MQSLQQYAAEHAADEAIAALLIAYERESGSAGATPLNWVIVVESVTVDDDGNVDCEFADVLTNHACRYSSARGLLCIGASEIEKGDE